MFRLLLCLVIGSLLDANLRAKEFPRPFSYAKAVGSEYQFVMLGPIEVDESAAGRDREALRQLRQQFPASGLYPRAGGTALWTTEASYAPSANTFPSRDGIHLAVIEGDWWTTKDYVSPKRLPAAKEAEQLQAPAVSFYAQGQLLRQYRVADLVSNPARLEHSPEHILWAAGAALNDETGRFVVMTQDGLQVTFDIRTGALLEKRGAGIANPLASWILGLCGILVLLILAGWALLTFGRRSPRLNAPATPTYS
jgi:hypothetical protein